MKNIKSFNFTMLAGIFILLFMASGAQAANPATINVTVTIQYLSLTATGPIAFGTVSSSTATVASDSSLVTNDGNVTETYSLNLTDPGGWTAVQAAPGAEEYCLSAMFNSDQPLSGDYAYADHALTTSSVASSASKFAGDQDGVSIATSGTLYLWLKFEAPTATTVSAEQTIVVTLTATAG